MSYWRISSCSSSLPNGLIKENIIANLSLACDLGFTSEGEKGLETGAGVWKADNPTPSERTSGNLGMWYSFTTKLSAFGGNRSGYKRSALPLARNYRKQKNRGKFVNHQQELIMLSSCNIYNVLCVWSPVCLLICLSVWLSVTLFKCLSTSMSFNIFCLA